MTWKTFQDDAFNLTKAEIDALSKDVLKNYTDARKAIEKELQALYLKYLGGVKPEDYYNAVIQRDILNKTLANITADYNAFSRKAGALVGQASEIGMSNTYYRKLYATQWIDPGYNFSYLPRSLVELTVYSTEDNWKQIKQRIIDDYGSLSNYTSKSGTLTGFLVNNRQTEVKKIQQLITTGLQQGKSYTSMMNDIKGIIGKDLMRDGKRFVTGAKANSMRIIRTESNRTLNAGSYANSKFADSMGVDIKRQLLSTLDNRTRPQSAQMDGQIVGVDEPFQYPGGVTAMYPGSTGIARFDINDRETVIDVVNGEGPQLRRGRNPETGKNEVFEYKGFESWAREKGLKRNKYGQLLFPE